MSGNRNQEVAAAMAEQRRKDDEQRVRSAAQRRAAVEHLRSVMQPGLLRVIEDAMADTFIAFIESWRGAEIAELREEVKRLRGETGQTATEIAETILRLVGREAPSAGIHEAMVEMVAARLERYRQAEIEETRRRCAEVTLMTARGISKGTISRCGSVEEIGNRISDAILSLDLSEVTHG